MKQPATYCFLAVGVASVVIAQWVREATSTFAYAYAIILRDKALPLATRCAIACPWWPYAFALAAAVGVTMCLATRIKSQTLCVAAFVLLLLELLTAAFSLLCFAVPLQLPPD